MLLNMNTLFGKLAVYFIQPTIRVRCRDWRASVAGIQLGVTLRIGLTRLKGKIMQDGNTSKLKRQPETGECRGRSSTVHSRRFKNNVFCEEWKHALGLPDLMFRLVRDTEGPVGLASLESWTKFYTSKGWRLWVDAADDFNVFDRPVTFQIPFLFFR